jgi:hypothetical protein
METDMIAKILEQEPGKAVVDMKSIDLRTVGRYRPRNEPMKRTARSHDDLWDLILPGRSGFVAPWGPGLLVACTNSTVTTKSILASVPGTAIVADGEDGQNVTFQVDHLPTVAGILRLRKKRTGTTSHLRAFQFFTPQPPEMARAKPSKAAMPGSGLSAASSSV